MTLDDLAIKYGTDKSSRHHDYCYQYEFHLSKYRNKPIILWNGGFGGYEFPDRGGGDTKMWREFFPKANIVVTDIHYKHQLNIPGVHVRQGAQDDEQFWLKILGETGPPDVFIDDMSHINSLTIRTFEIVFPLLKSGGTYIIEDIEGSWYPDHGFGGTKDLNDKTHPSIVNFCRNLLNELNSKYNGAEVKYGISSINFIPNSVIITKK
jgi:hypothetical protein